MSRLNRVRVKHGAQTAELLGLAISLRAGGGELVDQSGSAARRLLYSEHGVVPMKTRSVAELAAAEKRERDSAAEYRTRSATFSDKAAEADRELTALLAERATGGPDNKRADQLREQRADLLDRARGADVAAEERDRTAKSLHDERTQREIEAAVPAKTAGP